MTDGAETLLPVSAVRDCTLPNVMTWYFVNRTILVNHFTAPYLLIITFYARFTVKFNLMNEVYEPAEVDILDRSL